MYITKRIRMCSGCTCHMQMACDILPPTEVQMAKHRRDMPSVPLFTRPRRSGSEPGFESGSTGVRPGYVHTGSKVVVVKNCIPEVFI